MSTSFSQFVPDPEALEETSASDPSSSTGRGSSETSSYYSIHDSTSSDVSLRHNNFDSHQVAISSPSPPSPTLSNSTVRATGPAKKAASQDNLTHFPVRRGRSARSDPAHPYTRRSRSSIASTSRRSDPASRNDAIRHLRGMGPFPPFNIRRFQSLPLPNTSTLVNPSYPPPNTHIPSLEHPQSESVDSSHHIDNGGRFQQLLQASKPFINRILLSLPTPDEPQTSLPDRPPQQRAIQIIEGAFDDLDGGARSWFTGLEIDPLGDVDDPTFPGCIYEPIKSSVGAPPRHCDISAAADDVSSHPGDGDINMNEPVPRACDTSAQSAQQPSPSTPPYLSLEVPSQPPPMGSSFVGHELPSRDMPPLPIVGSSQVAAQSPSPAIAPTPSCDIQLPPISQVSNIPAWSGPEGQVLQAHPSTTDPTLSEVVQRMARLADSIQSIQANLERATQSFQVYPSPQPPRHEEQERVKVTKAPNRRPASKILIAAQVRLLFTHLLGGKTNLLSPSVSKEEARQFAASWNTDHGIPDHDCCTLEQFRYDLLGTPKSPWNQSAARVFTRGFQQWTKNGDPATIMPAFFTFVKTLQASYRLSLSTKHQKGDASSLARRKGRRRQTFHRRRTAALSHPMLRQCVPMLERLGVNGMSDDESGSEVDPYDRHASRPIYRTITPYWREPKVGHWLEVFDTVHLMHRRKANDMRGQYPRLRSRDPELINPNAIPVPKLPRSAYRREWSSLQRRFEDTVQPSSEEYTFQHDNEVLSMICP